MGALPGLCAGMSILHSQGMLWADWLLYCRGVLHREPQLCRLMVHLSLQCSQPIIKKGTAKLRLRRKNLGSSQLNVF